MNKRTLVIGGICCLLTAGCARDSVSSADHERAIGELSQHIDELRREVRDLTEEKARYGRHVEQLHSFVLDSIADFEEALDEVYAERDSLFGAALTIEDFDQIVAAIDHVVERVAELEYRVGGSMSAIDDEIGDDSLSEHGRMMRIERVETLPPDRSSDREIRELRDRAEQRTEAARLLDREIADLLQVYRDWELRTRRGAEYRERYRDRMIENRNKRRELTRQRRQLEQEARTLSGEATRLEREANTPRQRIIGSTGDLAIVLNTERDFSAQLARMPVGTTITWSGRLIAQDDESQTWIARRINRVDEADAP